MLFSSLVLINGTLGFCYFGLSRILSSCLFDVCRYRRARNLGIPFDCRPFGWFRFTSVLRRLYAVFDFLRRPRLVSLLFSSFLLRTSSSLLLSNNGSVPLFLALYLFQSTELVNDRC